MIILPNSPASFRKSLYSPNGDVIADMISPVVIPMSLRYRSVVSGPFDKPKAVELPDSSHITARSLIQFANANDLYASTKIAGPTASADGLSRSGRRRYNL